MALFEDTPHTNLPEPRCRFMQNRIKINKEEEEKKNNDKKTS